MKLLIAVVEEEDVAETAERLSKNLIPSSRIGTVRSWFSAKTTTLLIACPNEKVDDALAILRDVCSRRETRVVNSGYVGEQIFCSAEEGGGAVFVLDVEKFERL